jgi:superkiller protein 3
LFQEARTTEAVAEYRRALAANPNHVKANNNLALALLELGQLEEAAGHFKTSLQFEPKAEIYSDLGFAVARLGKSDEAFADYQKALELDPNCASAHANLAVAFVQTGKLDEAESHYRKALSGRPTAETHNGLGFVLARQGRVDEAIAEFQKAIDINPKFTPAYNNLAEALVQQGKLEQAKHYYRLSLAEKPSVAVSNALGNLLQKLGRTDEAAEQLGKASASDAGR